MESTLIWQAFFLMLYFIDIFKFFKKNFLIIENYLFYSGLNWEHLAQETPFMTLDTS
jgi:hypothetical protein